MWQNYFFRLQSIVEIYIFIKKKRFRNFEANKLNRPQWTISEDQN